MYVYLVKYNADMTEGRGPMMLSCIFSTRAEAEQYIDDKPGVMGIRRKWSQQQYGDWIVEEKMVYDSADSIREENKKAVRERALSKLTQEERDALDIAK